MAQETEVNALLSTAEVARLLRVDVRTVHALVRQGRLPALRLGRAFRFRPEALEALAERPKP